MGGPVLSTDPSAQPAAPSGGATNPVPVFVPTPGGTTGVPTTQTGAPGSAPGAIPNPALAAASAYSAELCNTTMNVTLAVPVAAGLKNYSQNQYHNQYEALYVTRAADGTVVTLKSLRHNADGSPNCTTILGPGTKDADNLKGVPPTEVGKEYGLMTTIQSGLNQLAEKQTPGAPKLNLSGEMDAATLTRLEQFAQAEGVQFRGGYDGPLSQAIERAYVKYGILK